MRILLMAILGVFLLSAPSLSYADSHTPFGAVTTTVVENPGTSAGIAGCAILVIFPPAAVWCAATVVGGATIDGHPQSLLEEAVQ
jgi:hypothetical protein